MNVIKMDSKMRKNIQKEEYGQKGVTAILGEIILVVISLLAISIISLFIINGMGNIIFYKNADARLSADTMCNRITITHLGGDSFKIEELKLGISIKYDEITFPDFTLLNTNGQTDGSGIWSTGKKLVVNISIEDGDRIEVILSDLNKYDVIAYGVVTPYSYITASVTQSSVTIPTSPPPTTMVSMTTTTTTASSCNYCAILYGTVQCGIVGQTLKVETNGCSPQYWILDECGFMFNDTAYGNDAIETFNFYLDNVLIDIRIIELVDCDYQAPPSHLIILDAC